MAKEKKEPVVRFKQLLTVKAMTLGFPEPPELVGQTEVLVGLDTAGEPWVLLANEYGTGWTTLRTNLLKTQPDIITGGQAIDLANSLPDIKE